MLWPIGSYTKGDGVSRFRVFPLYGRSTYKDKWKKTFVLWPLWTTVEYGYPNSRGSGFMLFPVVGHVKLTDQETWMLIPPLFRWSRGKDLTKLYAPWPFVQYCEGSTDLLYLWPAWGRKRQGETRSWFAKSTWTTGAASHAPRHSSSCTVNLPSSEISRPCPTAAASWAAS